MIRAANDSEDAVEYLERGRIKAEEIRHCAVKLLEFLAREEINSDEKLALKTMRGKQEFPMEERARVEIDTQPSRGDTYADTISYIIENRGILIEVRTNSRLNYKTIIVKSCDAFPNYSPFAQDMFGNIAQEKYHRGLSFQWVLNELEQLKKKSS